jgi:hypothetical protein
MSPIMIAAPGSNGGINSNGTRAHRTASNVSNGPGSMTPSPRTTASGVAGDMFTNMDGAQLRAYAFQKMYLLTADQLRNMMYVFALHTISLIAICLAAVLIIYDLVV